MTPPRSWLPLGIAAVGIALAAALVVGLGLPARGDRADAEAVSIAPLVATEDALEGTASASATVRVPALSAGGAARRTSVPAPPAAGPPTDATEATEATATLAGPAPTDATATPTQAATEAPAVTEASAATPVAVVAAPLLDVQVASTIGTGQTLDVRVASDGLALDQGATAAAVFADASVPLTAVDGGFWAVIGVSLNASLGEHVLGVSVKDALGAELASASVVVVVEQTERPVDYLELTPELTAVLTPEASAREAELRAIQFAQFGGAIEWQGAFTEPVAGRHTTQFGEGRSYNGGPVGNFHSGEDIAAELGTPLGAAARGRVDWAGEMPIRGNAVVIDHGGGVKTGYHHLDSISVSVGDVVEQGWEVGRLGSTGLSTGPHVHWELTVWGVNVDPMQWVESAYLP